MCYVRCHGMAAQKAAVHGGSCESGTGKLALHSAAACMASDPSSVEKRRSFLLTAWPTCMLLGIHMCLPLRAGRVHWLNATVFSACALGDAQLVRPSIKHAAWLGGTAKGVHCVWHGRLWTQGLQEGAKANLGLVDGGSSGSCMPGGCAGKLQLWALQDRCVCICPEPLPVAMLSAMQASCCCCCRACAACHTCTR